VPLDGVYRGSYYRMENRASVITRVTTEEGIVGEAYAADEDKTLGDIVGVIRDEIAPKLIGQDAFSYERCWELGYPATYDQLRDRRIGLVALACVDFAIWDAIGKALGQPLWRLWGGYRDRVPVNIIGGYYGRDLAGIRDEVEGWRAQGFRGAKFKVGGLEPRADAERVRAAREAAGDDFVLTIDANQGYTVQQALELCRRVSDLDIRWFEEPCIWSNDRRDMREVRTRGGIPVCAGQSEYAPGGCRDLFEAGAVDTQTGSGWRPRHGSTVSSSDTTRSRRSRSTCSPASRTAPTSRSSIPTATPSGGSSSPTARRSRMATSRCRTVRDSAGSSMLTSSPTTGSTSEPAILETIRAIIATAL
jgi:D-galactarolactone cycloisomerase